MGDDPLFDDDNEAVHQPRPWRPRFGIGALMLIMFIFCALFTMVYYTTLSPSAGVFNGRFMFIFLTLAMPMLLLTVLSTARAVIVWMEKANRRR